MAGVPDPNQAILSALSRLKATNQDLARHMDRMEMGGDTNSTPVQSPLTRETVSFNLPQGSRLGRDSSPIAPQRTHSQAHHGGGGGGVPVSHQFLPNASHTSFPHPLSSNISTGHMEVTEASRDAIGLSFVYDAPKIWNKLPDDVRFATSIASFRKKT